MNLSWTRMSISWPWQCLGPSLRPTSWAQLPAERSSGCRWRWAESPMPTKQRANAPVGQCRHLKRGKLAIPKLPPGGRRHFDARMSPWGAAQGSHFGMQLLLLGHHTASRNKLVVPAQQVKGTPVLGPGLGQAEEGNWCPNTTESMHHSLWLLKGGVWRRFLSDYT